MGISREIIYKENGVKLESHRVFHNFDDENTWNDDVNNFIDIIEAKNQFTFHRISKEMRLGKKIGAQIRSIVLSDPEKSRKVGESIGKAITGRT